MNYTPAVRSESFEVFPCALEVHREFKSLCGSVGQIQEAAPFGPFAPGKRLALVNPTFRRLYMRALAGRHSPRVRLRLAGGLAATYNHPLVALTPPFRY